MAGYAFEVMPADVDETPRDGESPRDYVVRVARDKAAVIAARHPAAVVLAADTTVAIGNEIFAKPDGRDDAARMLRAFSGRDHDVFTGVAVGRDGAMTTHLEHTLVTFDLLTEAEIAWYVASGEADDKAGAYGIQGLASRFIPRIQGSYSNVVGLPVSAVHRMLK